LTHDEYTHFILCPDDLEVNPTNLEILLNDVKCRDIETISGICNIDESQPHTYAIHPLGVDLTSEKPPVTYGSYYMRDKKPILPDTVFLEVGASGFACQVISRGLMEKLSWIGANNGGTGNFDWQFSKDCHKLGIPIMADLRVKLWHRRQEQWDRVQEFKTNPIKPEGYSFLLK